LPNNDQHSEIQRTFANQVLQLWFKALRLDPELVKLSKDEVNSLNEYFYANELIVRCKEAAVRVSPQVWAGIEERMLTARIRSERAITPSDDL
jgi:hypothetical protein